MLAVGGGSNSLNKIIEEELETLGFSMGLEDEEKLSIVKVEDVEEGEISDTASVEEISEEDFNKQEVDVKPPTSNKETSKQKEQGNGNGRVWTMSDLYRYQMGGGYVSGLYNLAWAQAVQSKPGQSNTKPLNELLVHDVVEEADENSKRSSPSSSVASFNSNTATKDDDNAEKKKVDKVVIGDSGDEMDVDDYNNKIDKEEGELEEGEINLDMEPGDKVSNNCNADVSSSNELLNTVDEDESKHKILEKKLNYIREALDGITAVEANKSFDAVCSKICNTIESLRDAVQEKNVSAKDDLVPLLFATVRLIYSAFSSMNYKLREINMEKFSRLLYLVNSCIPSLFPIEHAKEIEVMLASVDSSHILVSSLCSEKNKEAPIPHVKRKRDNEVVAIGHDVINMNKLPIESFVNANANMSLEAPKSGLPTLKARPVLIPLLDLHKDHDADSLPSPTREAAPALPGHRGFTPRLVLDTGGPRMHPYETDAVKAVSSYQQKFSRSSFPLTDRLPSPTPSEESGNGDGDMAGEVSSAPSISNFRSANPPSSAQAGTSISTPWSDGSSMPGVIQIKGAVPATSVQSSTVKPLAKSRDPRLRFANANTSSLDSNHRTFPVVNVTKADAIGGTMNSKRHKTVDDPIHDDHLLKRQRNALENSGNARDVKTMVGRGGWLEDTDIVGPQITNGNQLVDNTEFSRRRTDGGSCPITVSGVCDAGINESERMPPTGTNANNRGEQGPVTNITAVSIPDLLKNIAVNPTMLINILKMGQQQRLAAEAQQKPAEPAKTTAHPLNSNSMVGTAHVVNAGLPQPSGILSRPAGTVQVSSQLSTADESGKIRMKPRDPRRVLHNNTLQRNGSAGSEHVKVNVTSLPSNQEIKDNQNLQKLQGQAEMKPILSQSLAPPDISTPFTRSLKNIADIVSVSHSPTSQPLVPHQPPRIAASNPDQLVGIASASAVAAAAGSGSRAQNAWGDVEHLFEGYNDQQKAAIQRERARRIEEQKKLFSAQKLCLVLDLDHTLLNSAKFGEVDPVHDEILRKKEEQDREKQHRHLFRFPHMGMWTKLRPGIWNFLEKASKLYELHLYTMGNRLYATEMAKVLDPTGALFNGRVISRGDDGDPFDGDERVPKSKDLEGVLGMESGVVIIDDSVRVWPHNKLNLIVVERYIYFPCSRRQFGLPGPSLLEIDHDERPEDGTLACSLAVIERIHNNFFNHQSLDDADVRNILSSEQRKILAGCRILFSRMFPVGEANPHLHPLWQTAEQFGAVCTNQIDEQVTHVVANAHGTDKVNWALSTGRFVVYPGWVEASALLYRRANEQDFAIKP